MSTRTSSRSATSQPASKRLKTPTIGEEVTDETQDSTLETDTKQSEIEGGKDVTGDEASKKSTESVVDEPADKQKKLGKVKKSKGNLKDDATHDSDKEEGELEDEQARKTAENRRLRESILFAERQKRYEEELLHEMNLQYSKIDDDLEKFEDSVEYKGFNPLVIRKKVLSIYKESSLLKHQLNVVKLLGALLISYMKFGNNINRAQFDEDKGSENTFNEAVQAFKIVKSATTSDQITLPRLAIALMPLSLMVRLSLKHVDERATGISPVYQDVCFAGCNLINSISGYKEFYYQFSKSLTKKVEKTKKDVQDVLMEFVMGKLIGDESTQEFDKWMKIAEAGYNKDEFIHAEMRTIMERGRVINLSKYIHLCLDGGLWTEG